MVKIFNWSKYTTKIANLIRSENLTILEIGPGDGKLTDKIILKKPSMLTLVEIDKDLIKNLNKDI